MTIAFAGARPSPVEPGSVPDCGPAGAPAPTARLLDRYLLAAGVDDAARRQRLIGRVAARFRSAGADGDATSCSAVLTALRRELAADAVPSAGVPPVPMAAPLDMPSRPFRRLVPSPHRLLRWSVASVGPRGDGPATAAGS